MVLVCVTLSLRFFLILGIFPTVPDALSARAKAIYDGVTDMIDREIIPIEQQLIDYSTGDHQWTQNPRIEQLKVFSTVMSVIHSSIIGDSEVSWSLESIHTDESRSDWQIWLTTE